MAKKVTADRLYDLQDKLITYLVEELDSGEALSSGTLQAIRGVLKDNDITSGIAESEPMQDLVSTLMKKHREEIEG
jgi:ABC-type Zn uptake system ZnuABC Zn-binding protein ZnuA